MELLPVFTADAEGQQVSNVKYLTGSPRQIRFDAKKGEFNVNGKEPLGSTLSFQPLAWEFFDANILNMGQKSWVEMFYLDEKNRLCAVLFHGNSVNALKQVSVPLFYDDLTLADVILTITPEKKENTKITPKGVYYIANFSYAMADPKRTADLAEYAGKYNIYREETINDTRIGSVSQGYNVPQHIISRVFGLNSNSHIAELPAVD
ncbi:hypothetical protein [Fibrella forsythiae]|uniref:Uncharacterized protein n=1 Tax=Fibrella forsythiae TaxID=2817061 RepID=A0ABS3JLJ0_9BACT|nr:hypothetical protein [Fibrella forsythiae]MBO0950868.1 hypothetical protein [Fibrella forsythiae]